MNETVSDMDIFSPLFLGKYYFSWPIVGFILVDGKSILGLRLV